MGLKCQVVIQHADKRFEIVEFEAIEGECVDRAGEIAFARRAQYVTCSRLREPSQSAFTCIGDAANAD